MSLILMTASWFLFILAFSYLRWCYIKLWKWICSNFHKYSYYLGKNELQINSEICDDQWIILRLLIYKLKCKCQLFRFLFKFSEIWEISLLKAGIRVVEEVLLLALGGVLGSAISPLIKFQLLVKKSFIG